MEQRLCIRFYAVPHQRGEIDPNDGYTKEQLGYKRWKHSRHNNFEAIEGAPGVFNTKKKDKNNLSLRRSQGACLTQKT